MTTPSARLLSLAVEYPHVRINDYWHTHHPEVISQAESKILSGIWKRHEGACAGDPWDEEMLPYLSDPFRGAKQRCVLEEGRSILDMELEAARKALSAAHFSIGDIDLILATSFLSDNPGIGNSAFLARDLGYDGAGWNIESGCNSALVCLEAGEAFIRTGQAKNVLVVVSCTYSRLARPSNTMSLVSGDGCIAYVLSATKDNTGILSVANLHTAVTCGAVMFRAKAPDEMEFKVSRTAGVQLREGTRKALEQCSALALERAGVQRSDIDFFIFPTASAWHVPFYRRVLGVPEEKTIDLFSKFGNTGPALSFTNLYYAAHEGMIRPGDLVLLHAIGSSSSASSMVLRWGDVTLGTLPELKVEAF